LIMEIAWIGLAASTLPPYLLAQILWPGFGSHAHHFFGFNGWRSLAVTKVPVLLGFSLVVFLILSAWKSRTKILTHPLFKIPCLPEFVFLAALFPLALLLTLNTSAATMQFSWVCLLVIIFVFDKVSWPYRVLLLAICVPCFWYSLGVFRPEVTARQKINHHGQSLWLTPQEQLRVKQMEKKLQELRLKAPPGRNRIQAIPVVCGLYHFAGYQPSTKHRWLYPGSVPLREEKMLIDSLNYSFAVVLMTPQPLTSAPTRNPRSWGVWDPKLTDLANRDFQEKLVDPIRIDDHCFIFPVAP
jgi:hypothetical protein